MPEDTNHEHGGEMDLHAHLLHMLGAQDHEDAARIIGELHAAQIKPEAVQVPQGWRLVPEKPTDEMMRVGYWSGAGNVSIQEEWARREVWGRMLAAAPQPPALADHEDPPQWLPPSKFDEWDRMQRAQPEARGDEPVAWCALTASGKIAYFDGKPSVMPGPVGNECHPHPLYTHPDPAAPQSEGPILSLLLAAGHVTQRQVDQARAIVAKTPGFAPSAPQAGEAETAPIDMVLHCPECGAQHIDAPEWVDDPHDIEQGRILGWKNPPHRSHLCHGCGHIWRPADVPTNGVSAVKTRGKADSALASQPMSREGMSQAAQDVLAERRRQIEAEGWTPEHDDAHNNGELAEAAGCYALHHNDPGLKGAPAWWPWHAAWWKPADPRRNLIKAGALILAELERLDRASAHGIGSGEGVA